MIKTKKYFSMKYIFLTICLLKLNQANTIEIDFNGTTLVSNANVLNSYSRRIGICKARSFFIESSKNSFISNSINFSISRCKKKKNFNFLIEITFIKTIFSNCL